MAGEKDIPPARSEDPGDEEFNHFETGTQLNPPVTGTRPLSAAGSLDGSTLDEIAQRLLWLSTAMIDAANRGRKNTDGIKVGGHQASSASMVGIMTALWFVKLRSEDRVSVKPHASPVLHAINYLLGELGEEFLPTLRSKGGLQPYPSRTKDPDTVDFSTGSVGIGATAPLWAALSHRYLSEHFPETAPAGRFYSLLGDAEMDEGAVWEAIIDPEVRHLGEVVWIVDLNRQSLDRVIPDVQIQRLKGMFGAADWQVLTAEWGSRLEGLFKLPGGDAFERRMRAMPNEEFQRLLRSHPENLHERLLAGVEDAETTGLTALLESLSSIELAEAVRDLGGHDINKLLETFDAIDDQRPTIIFAYTIKGRGLATEGHPGNHSAQLTENQMQELARISGTNLDSPWQKFESGTAAAQLCVETAQRLSRAVITQEKIPEIPKELGFRPKAVVSTQATLGRLISDLARVSPEVAKRVVTLSPDVATSTNLAGWINKTGVWSISERQDWFADDPERMLRWHEGARGQHIELGIAEVNLVCLAGELGATFSRWGQPLIPIATLYDPFINRALEPWTFGIYAGGQSIVVGTPSGVTLSPEGGAHQSLNTPSVTLEIPGLTSWEPAFAQDLEWAMLEAMSNVGVQGGESSYFRLSTRPIEQSLAAVPEDGLLRERRRKDVIAGGYRLSEHPVATDQITLVGVGAIMPEVCLAAEILAHHQIRAGVVCLTSPDRIFRALNQRENITSANNSAILQRLFPSEHCTPIVSVQDAHPHTLSFLSAIRGDRARNLGVKEFGQGSSLQDAYKLHGIDAESIASSALDLLGR